MIIEIVLFCGGLAAAALSAVILPGRLCRPVKIPRPVRRAEYQIHHAAFMAALFVYGIFCAVKNRPAGKKGSENGIKKSSGKGRILNAAVLAVLFFVLAFTGYL